MDQDGVTTSSESFAYELQAPVEVSFDVFSKCVLDLNLEVGEVFRERSRELSCCHKDMREAIVLHQPKVVGGLEVADVNSVDDLVYPVGKHLDH
jgi:hypothetical protein